jgi:zona occludens toxin (predicted ATPase)
MEDEEWPSDDDQEQYWPADDNS